MASRSATLKQTIRVAAQRLGFDLCGFARAGVPPHAEFVTQWLADGNAASMAYLKRHVRRRLDPGRVLRAVQTIVTLGYRYRPAPAPPVDWRSELRGRVAAYALGTDYHLTMQAKLRELATLIENLDGHAAIRTYVDTGPILEREWAAAGGLGWFGKNTNILHSSEGSWFFLAEVLTTLVLEPDPAWPDHCGTCTRCLDLCPTGALSEGYRLDARLCIAYWTIEHRGAIPHAMRPQLGSWVFGCDVCQEVCPWNEKLAQRGEPPGSDELAPFLPELLALGEEAFRARFQMSAIWRTQREGLARNAAIVLGNTRNPAAVPPLQRALGNDPSPIVRGHAAWALGQIDCAAARAALDQVFGDPDPEVRDEVKAAREAVPLTG